MKWFRGRAHHRGRDASEPKVRVMELGGAVCDALQLMQRASAIKYREDFFRPWGCVDIKIETDGDTKVVHASGWLYGSLSNTEPRVDSLLVASECHFRNASHGHLARWRPFLLKADHGDYDVIKTPIEGGQGRGSWYELRLKGPSSLPEVEVSL